MQDDNQKYALSNIDLVTTIARSSDSKPNSIGASDDIAAIKTWLLEFRDSPNTFISYRQTAERFLLWCVSRNLRLTDVTREVVQNYQDFLANPTPKERWCGKARPRGHKDWRPFVRGLSPTSIRLNLQILTSLYNYMVAGNYLGHNPFGLVRRKSADIIKGKGVEHFLTAKEWQYILDFIETEFKKTTEYEILVYSRIRWIFILLYLTGCRRSEIAGGKMADFVYKHSNWWLKVVGKGSKYGEVPVTNQLLSELINYRKSIKLPDYPKESEQQIGLVNELTGKKITYTPISDSMLYKLIKQTCRSVAEHIRNSDPSAAYVIEKVSTHWIRHTSATHQVDAGIDIRIVKENLRHSLLETTMKYQHADADARHQETNQKFGIKPPKD